jgi:hypothetical protein
MRKNGLLIFFDIIALLVTGWESKTIVVPLELPRILKK